MYELSGIRMVRDGRTILSIDHLTIPTNEMTLILGHNGSGKSTLASVISGLVEPDAGKVMLNGKDLFALSERDRAREVAFLPQKLPASAGLICRELVRLGRYPWRGLFGRWRGEDERAIDAALEPVCARLCGRPFGGRTSARLDRDALSTGLARDDSRRTNFSP